jgi:hypothetical protein
MLNNIENIIKELLYIKEEIKKSEEKEKKYLEWLRKFKKENERLVKTNNILKQQKNNALEKLFFLQENASKLKRAEELIFANKFVCKQRDDALAELSTKKAELLHSLQEARKAKIDRDLAIQNLDDVIKNLEAYQNICQEIKNKIYIGEQDFTTVLIEKAETLLFKEEIIEVIFNEVEQPQMFTDTASINRSLLDR